MFPKALRLNRSEKIKKVVERGLNIRMPFFILKYIYSEDFKITIVVSKKVSKLAVNRNRIKRIFRAAIQNLLKFEKIKWNIVFFPHSDSLLLKSIDLQPLINKAFNKIKENTWKNF